MTGEWRAREYENEAASSISNVSNDTVDQGIGASHEGLLH
jgi:hypothetical protein